MSLFTPSTSGSYRYGRFNGPLEFLEIIVERVLLVSCQNIVTLNAQIVGDETDHTFYWEQTGGPAVIWLEPQNQTMVMYEKNPSDTNGDCFFRFWIDRYTPFQQFRDLVVSGSARDDILFKPILKNTGVIQQPFTSAMNIFPDFTYSPSITLNNPDKILVFNLPFLTPAIGTKNIVYEYNDGNLIEKQQLSADSRLFLTPESGKFYVIRYFYFLSGAPYEFFYETNQPFYFDSSASSSLMTLDTGEIVGKIGSLKNGGSANFFQTAILELTQLDNQDTADGLMSNYRYNGNITMIETQIVSLLPLPEIPEDDVVGINNIIGNNIGFISIFQVQLSDGITVIG